MSTNVDLIINADTALGQAELHLRDAHGAQLAYRLTDFKTIDVSQKRGLFDLRNYLRHYAKGVNDAASVAALGVCIAEQVLGTEIFTLLYASESQRTLRIQLPGAPSGTEDDGNQLAAALARVPWEIARPSADKPTLGERNLLVRVVHDMQEPATHPLDFKTDESLRVLFVFGEAQGSTPLAVRKERQELLRLFEKEIYPTRRIEAHFLSHGVTRERLRDEIERNGGYHIVHWSGHGHLNLLELAKAGGGSDHLSGEELLGLFKQAGGFIPRLFFLSACHSGDILRVKDWNEFMAVAQGIDLTTREASTEATKDIAVDEQPGYTGTAHALLQGGVPAVVAMRYAVGDEYARDLAVEFYRLLLAQPHPKTAAAALTLARKHLLAANNQSRYAACDHATPLLYGAEHPGLRWEKGRSPALNPRDSRLHQINELTPAAHEHFVGRTWQLAALGAQFIGSDQQPVALITGLGGMGKTALTAEALSLWRQNFKWVLLYQAKPNALSFDRDFLWNIDMRLRDKSDDYRAWIAANSRDAIWLEPEGDFTGTRRMGVMIENLIAFMRAYDILIVIDNFETNLKPQATDPNAPKPRWTCADPAWEECLRQLAEQLRGTRSRVWLTCRQPLAALAGDGCQHVLLGPLPSGEAALYLREHAELSRMFFSPDASASALAMRLLNASRFHPLLMDRLAKLAVGGDALKPQLLQALDTLEKTKDFAQLPALFATQAGDTKELAYLNDALAASLDQLIQQASPDARRLLWMIAVANEPIELSLLESVWSGEEGEQTQQLRQFKQAWEMKHLLPPEVLAQLEALMTPEVHAMIDALPPPTTDHRPPATDYLPSLISVGLVTADDDQTLTCHELVRERSRARMHDHAAERDGLTENAIRLAYADRLAAAFTALENQNMTAALSAGSRALVYCVQAEAYDRLGQFASGVVTSTRDPRLLAGLIPHLDAAAKSAPAGRPRWSCLCYLADALMEVQPDASLPFYEQAEALARAAATDPAADRDDARRAWSDVGWITGNWANALGDVGHLDAARQQHINSAEAMRNAGRPAIHVIRSEVEALRIDIMQGQVAQALPQVEARLKRIEAWWQQHRAGRPVPEAPDPAFLARGIISTLDIATDAHVAQQDWAAALPRIDAILAVKRALDRPAEDLAATRGNRANVLGRLGRFGEAQAELEACLQLFQHSPADSAKALSSLADLFDKQGDVAQAIRQQRRALALCEQLPDPRDRASSHHNLANYLERSGLPAALAESPRHQLAALVYRLVAGLGQDLQTSLGNYAIRFRRAHEAGTPLVVPRLSDLLADPAFDPLARWLRGRQVDEDELQAAVDALLEQVQQNAIR